MGKIRAVSITGVYHVVVRGNNKSDIFYSDEDNYKFLYILQDLQEKKRVEVYAYCLMVNHAHLLLRVTQEPVAEVMRSALLRYVKWYNKKYERIGKLFQDRFFSNPVQDTRYYLAGLQYIYNNPVKAGLSQSALDYKWSSFRQLLMPVHNMPKLAPTLQQLPLGEELLHLMDSDLSLAEWEPHELLYDTDAIALAMETLGLKEWKDIHNVERRQLEKCVRVLAQHGASKRQIIRVLGVTRYNVQKLLT